MNKEFKKINSKTETRYILETASVGGTSAGDIGSAISNLETIQRRLQELKKSVTVPTKKPRNPVNMGTQLGRGTQKHERSNRKKEKDSKKIFELNNNGKNLFIKFRLSELPNEETRIIMFGGYGNKPKDVKRQDSIFTPISIDYRDIDNSLMKIKSMISNLDSEENEKIFIDIPSYLDDILTDIKDRITSELIDDNKNIELYRKPRIDNELKKDHEDDEEDSLHYLMTNPKGQKLSNIDPEDNTDNKDKEKDLPVSSENNLIIPTNVDGNRFIKQLVSDGILNSNDIKLLGNTLYISKEDFEIVKKELKQRNLKDVNIHKYFPVKKVMRENKELDHEINMARNELKSIIADAQKIMSKLKKYSEEEGIMAWQQSKITKSADFMNSVNQSLDENKSTDLKKKVEDELSEDLRKWFKEKWVRFGPDGKIRGACARGNKSEGKPKCLPQSKAHALGKKDRASAAARKRREDPNPERKGSAINVKTKESDQNVDESCWDTHKQVGMKKKGSKMVPNCVPKENKNMKKEQCPECGGPIFPESVINEKKDACYYKVKSRYKVWPSAYACVPEETSKALTRDGWKHVDNLSIGEEIMTYNMSKDIMEFKPILNLHRYNNVITNVVKSGNTGFMFECTPNHKWVVKLPEQSSDRVSKYDKINGMILLETNQMLDVKNNKHLVVTAPYEDGKYIKKDKIFKYGDNWIKYILEISPEQRQSWLFSAIVYDGDQRKTERITENKKGINDLDWEYSGNHGKQSFGFKQKDIMHRDAFLLAAFLNGGTVTWKKYTNRDIYSCHFVNNKRYKNLWNFKNTKENVKNVWCPETENNTWVMMQETNGNGIITITGNSGALVKCRKKGSKNWGSKKENMQNNNKKLSEQESQNDELELQKIKEKNLKFIKKLINPDTVGAGNSLSDSQKSAMMDNASKQPEMQKNPLDLVKFALDIGYSPEDVLDSIPLGLDLSKDLPKS